jgi:malic enzyme
MDYSEKSLELHHVKHGKIETGLKVPLETKDDLSTAYTPGVAAVCQTIAQDPAQARELTIKRNTIAVVTDGSAVLGLGNIGPLAGLPVMEGKAALFKRFANVDAFPICLDTQDTEEIIQAVKHIAPVFGGINLEDIAAPKCFEIEARLKAELNIPVMHDDQHGTAVVVLAALINALKLRGKEKTNVCVPCWSSCITGMLSSALRRASISKHLGAAMSSRFMPPNTGAICLTACIISSVSCVSKQIGKASTFANRLKSAALPSITGRPASGPILPSPSTAEPSVTTAIVLRFMVNSRA